MSQSCFTRIPFRSSRAAHPFGAPDHVLHTSSRCVKHPVFSRQCGGLLYALRIYLSGNQHQLKFVRKFPNSSKNFQKNCQKILVISKYSIISPNCLCDSSRRPNWALAGLAIAADGPSSPHQARDSSRRPVKALLGPGITPLKITRFYKCTLNFSIPPVSNSILISFVCSPARTLRFPNVFAGDSVQISFPIFRNLLEILRGNRLDPCVGDLSVPGSLPPIIFS